MSNIHGLGPVKKDKKNENMEEFFEPGKSSGTAVLRPTGGGPAGDPMQDMIRNARGNAGNADPEAMSRNLGVITIYANGFRLGDGEFQPITIPKNAAFIKSLKEGAVPAELEEQVRKQFGAQADSVGIHLQDKSSETYVPPKVEQKFDFSSSQGVTLGGSATPAVPVSSSLTPQEYQVDASQPQTIIQVVLANKQKLRVNINQTATVGQLYQHVMHVSTLRSFSLAGGFPPKPLTDYGATIKAAGLVGASVTQR